MLSSTSIHAATRGVCEPKGFKRFSDQVVIVTGASRGIGRGIACLFAEEGAKVVLVGRDEAQLEAVKASIQDSEGQAIFVKADVSNPKDMERMVDEALSQYGRIDVLCHNAGIYPHARLENMTLEEWQTVIDVNLTGTFLAVKACIPAMKSQGQGKIVITSSISGPQTALPGYSHYTASKGGVAGFIRTAAVELAKYHINVNGVEPGNIMTEGLDATGSEHINNMVRAIPLGRLGTPEDVAHAILFLSSKEASYITGQNLIIDGGQTLPESHFFEEETHMSKQYSIEESGAFTKVHSIKGASQGLLKGLKFAVKDLIDIQGIPTSGGNPSWQETHPEAVVNAVCVEQLLSAGAECIGKTVTDELAFGLCGENHFWGTPVNPKCPERIPGGSSSGSASAVACGLVDFALGTDTGGSVRVPASNCGIFGFRPSHGIVSVAGVLPFAPTFDTVGILASSCSILHKAASVLMSFKPSNGQTAGQIHWVKESFELIEPEVQEALASIRQLLEKLFPDKVNEISIRQIDRDPNTSGLENWYEIYCTNQWAEIWSTLGSWIESTHPQFGPATKINFELTKNLDRGKIREALQKREQYYRSLKNFLGKRDILCIPTVPLPAPLKGSLGHTRTEGNYYPRVLGLTAIAGIGRLPQITLPLAEVGGAPVGLSIIGAYGEDAFLHSIAEQISIAAEISG